MAHDEKRAPRVDVPIVPRRLGDDEFPGKLDRVGLLDPELDFQPPCIRHQREGVVGNAELGEDRAAPPRDPIGRRWHVPPAAALAQQPGQLRHDLAFRRMQPPIVRRVVADGDRGFAWPRRFDRRGHIRIRCVHGSAAYTGRPSSFASRTARSFVRMKQVNAIIPLDGRLPCANPPTSRLRAFSVSMISHAVLVLGLMLAFREVREANEPTAADTSAPTQLVWIPAPGASGGGGGGGSRTREPARLLHRSGADRVSTPAVRSSVVELIEREPEHAIVIPALPLAADSLTLPGAMDGAAFSVVSLDPVQTGSIPAEAAGADRGTVRASGPAMTATAAVGRTAAAVS